GAGTYQAELAPILARRFPSLVPQPAGEARRAAHAERRVTGVVRPDVRFVDDAIDVYEFDFVADLGTTDEAVAILRRLFGPEPAAYLRERDQSTVWSRQAIYSGRVAKEFGEVGE